MVAVALAVVNNGGVVGKNLLQVEHTLPSGDAALLRTD
jgi:hypothetical protein